MENAYQIFEYLPRKYKIQSDAEYFNFLIHSVQQNYDAGNYHFALVALHMIYMGIVYHYLFRIYLASPTKFNDILIGFHHYLEDSQKKRKKNSIGEEQFSWHDLSSIKERAIFQFYRTVGLKEDVIGKLRKPVDERNDAAHTNGVYFNSDEAFDSKVNTYLECLEKIDQACNKFTNKLFNKFQRALTIELLDEDETKEYILEDFVPNNAMSTYSLVKLSEINKSKYVGTTHNKNLIYNVIQNIREI